MGRKSAKSILSVARRIDEFKPDIIYTFGSMVALHPLIERLAADPALCKTLADNAAHDIPVYTWAEIAQQFEDYFKVLFSDASA